MIMSCIQSVKDTKFKAIHNYLSECSKNYTVVFNLSKIQNLKRFTTNKRLTSGNYAVVFNLSKIQNLKRFTTQQVALRYLPCVVFNLSKIQNLKRFTTQSLLTIEKKCCIQSVKDT